MQNCDPSSCRADLDQSLLIQPSVIGYYMRAQVNEARGKPDLAIADYQKAVNLMPANVFDSTAQALAKARLDQLGSGNSCGGSSGRNADQRCL